MVYHRAPKLINLYMSDISLTTSKQFQYTDYIALIYQSQTFSECEVNIKMDLPSLTTATEPRTNGNVRLPSKHTSSQPKAGSNVRKHSNSTPRPTQVPWCYPEPNANLQTISRKIGAHANLIQKKTS
jgi:hypothetical protein